MSAGRESGYGGPGPAGWRGRGSDPQLLGDLPGVGLLCGHRRGLQPYLLAAGLAFHGQPAAFRVPHGTGLAPAIPPVTQMRRP